MFQDEQVLVTRYNIICPGCNCQTKNFYIILITTNIFGKGSWIKYETMFLKKFMYGIHHFGRKFYLCPQISCNLTQ